MTSDGITEIIKGVLRGGETVGENAVCPRSNLRQDKGKLEAMTPAGEADNEKANGVAVLQLAATKFVKEEVAKTTAGEENAKTQRNPRLRRQIPRSSRYAVKADIKEDREGRQKGQES